MSLRTQFDDWIGLQSTRLSVSRDPGSADRPYCLSREDELLPSSGELDEPPPPELEPPPSSEFSLPCE